MAAIHPLIQLGVQPGDFILIRYNVGGRRVWHERLVLCLAVAAPWGVGILTPDGDAYVEIVIGGVDIVGCIVCVAAATYCEVEFFLDGGGWLPPRLHLPWGRPPASIAGP